MPNLFTNKQTLDFYIIVPPKMFQGKTKSEKFSLDFL